jgi:hypothetical protein
MKKASSLVAPSEQKAASVILGWSIVNDMDISLLTKDNLWATATALVDRIGFEDGYEAIRGIIVEPKQVASIARRVVAEVYPEPEDDDIAKAMAFEITKLYVIAAAACQFYSLAFDNAYHATHPIPTDKDGKNDAPLQ